ncbi:DNA-protecting protein DprA [Brachybacterium endophyticum]|uniref:DNA-protecting protein DprA n=1 Tax=Brachybacterium endophyticum TaxID=2182385 RepID=A0A2U2RLK9_9MICO|nr:DNA-processing protein DprA [Brachybacterium endophyticum]PWH06726.1 DNA-protecting protein DprA [Brachybacterium endophyticum]
MTLDDDRISRVTWSLLAEPSDAAAHATCTEYGAGAGLEILAAEDVGPIARAIEKHRLADPSDPTTRRQDPQVSGRAALRRWSERRRRIDVDAVLDQAREQGMRVIVPGDQEWPSALEDLDKRAPFCLWAHGPGRADALTGAHAVAMVGSRASTAYGEDCAGSFSAALAGEGIPILSGGAYGIDAAAHRGALGVDGATVAILAGGLDRLYPRGNERLLQAVRERHLLLSEAPPGTAPTRWRFLERNRLIAALARVTVVVEASWRSGALSTARRAEDIGRTIAAVPGPVASAASAGCHRLIRENGATLVTEAQEIRELLPHTDPAGESSHAVQDELDILSPVEHRVLDAVPPRSATSPRRVGEEIGWEEREVRAVLGRLDLLGIVRVEGERVRRR